jgi:hypothetical protein
VGVRAVPSFDLRLLVAFPLCRNFEIPQRRLFLNPSLVVGAVIVVTAGSREADLEW